ncbi:MAG: sterol desaturase family protein [Alphaproteobacteria bacterium]|nr:sterol desaturase family protein [Alphaproteobacteria bacterium]
MEQTALALARQLALFGALLMPLEILWPARAGQALARRGLLTDLGWAALTPFVVGGLATGLLAALSLSLSWLMPAGLRAALAAQPWALQFVEILLLSELGTYWAHRASHAWAPLWRLHAVHHSPQEMDWLSAHRQHPLEALWHLGVANLPVLALGFPTASILGFIFFQKLHTAFVHANLRLPEGPWERWLAGPRFHRWHHARLDAQGGGEACNFTTLLPVVDRVFGTWRMPEGQPEALGVEEWVPETVWGQVWWPFFGAGVTGPLSPSASTARGGDQRSPDAARSTSSPT